MVIVPLEARFLMKGLFSAMALCTEADMLIVRLLSRGLFSGRHNAIDNASVALLRPLNWFGGRRQL